jgi:hypothetical protein
MFSPNHVSEALYLLNVGIPKRDNYIVVLQNSDIK